MAGNALTRQNEIVSGLVFPGHGDVTAGGHSDVLAAVVHLNALDPRRAVVLVDAHTRERHVGRRPGQQTALVGRHNGLQHKLHRNTETQKHSGMRIDKERRRKRKEERQTHAYRYTHAHVPWQP